MEVEDQRMTKAKSTSFFWPTLRGIALIVASCGFIAFLSESLHREYWGIGLPVFIVGTVALIAMTPLPYTQSAINNEGTLNRIQRRVPWSLIAYSFITGAGFNWMSVFLAFSRKYAFFSAPVVVATAFIMAFYSAIGFLIAGLTGGNWRKGLAVSGASALAVGAIALRLMR